MPNWVKSQQNLDQNSELEVTQTKLTRFKDTFTKKNRLPTQLEIEKLGVFLEALYTIIFILFNYKALLRNIHSCGLTCTA
jgi:hypothetical protein